MKNVKKVMSTILVASLMAMVFPSCSTENILLNEETVELNLKANQEKSVKDMAQLILEQLSVMTYDSELVETNGESVLFEYGNADENIEYTYSEIGAIMESNFAISKDDIEKLLAIAYENRAFLSQKGIKKALAEELYTQGREMVNENRLIFGLLNSIFGSEDQHCSVAILAGIADMMVGAALAATGVGLPLAGPRLVAGLANLAIDTHNCS